MKNSIVLVFLAIVAVSSIGFLSGWFSGISGSPVTGTIVTGSLTFLGVLVTTAFVLKQGKEHPLADLRELFPIVNALSVCIIAFALSCLAGALVGTNMKYNSYPELSETLKRSGLDESGFNTNDKLRLHLIYWELQAQGRSLKSIHGFFRQLSSDPKSKDLVKIKDLLKELRELENANSMIANQLDEDFKNPRGT